MTCETLDKTSPPPINTKQLASQTFTVRRHFRITFTHTYTHTRTVRAANDVRESRARVHVGCVIYDTTKVWMTA